MDRSAEQIYWDWAKSEPLSDCCVDAENVPAGPQYWERMLAAGKDAVAMRKEEQA